MRQCYFVTTFLLPCFAFCAQQQGLDGSLPEVLKRSTSSFSTSSTPLTAIATLTTILATAVPTTATASLIGPSNYNFPSTSDPTYFANYTNTDNTTFPVSGSPSTNWTVLSDTTSTVQLISNTDGNLYLAAYSNASTPQPGASFQATNNIVSTDMQARFFHYYPDEIAAYNVSRIRMSQIASTPLRSRMITLVPFSAPNVTQPVYAAVDTAGSHFYLAWCNIIGQVSKVFLVRDMNASIAMLQSPTTQNTVTGGVTGLCAPLALTASI